MVVVDDSEDGELGVAIGAFVVDGVERDDVQLAIVHAAMAHEMRRKEVRIAPRLSYWDVAFVSCGECI